MPHEEVAGALAHLGAGEFCAGLVEHVLVEGADMVVEVLDVDIQPRYARISFR